MPAKRKDDKKEEEEPTEETGTYIFGNDSARYVGKVVKKDGQIKRCGNGVYTDANIKYDGEWVDDAMNGHGVIYFLKSGACYSGSFCSSAFDGVGVYKWPDGSSYEGAWRFNRMHGEGKYTDMYGKVWYGKFYNGTGPGLDIRLPVV